MPAKAKVLIVDDEERFRITLRKLLTANGLETNAVSSGMEAIEALKQNLYDVILLDVKMPGMSGIEALAELKKINRDVEVIILTGHASVDVAVEIMRLGGYEYLLKPCPMDELLAKIESAFERKTARQERMKNTHTNPPAQAS
jgi:DNA-binding NtrC family response regulator